MKATVRQMSRQIRGVTEANGVAELVTIYFDDSKASQARRKTISAEARQTRSMKSTFLL